MSKSTIALVSVGLGLAVAMGAGCSPPAEKGAGSTPGSPISAEEAGRRAAQILAQESPLARIADLSSLLQRCGPDAVPALLDAYEGAPLDGGDPEIVVLATWWSAFDPKAAFAWTSSDWRATYGAVIAAVFRGWAHSDPQAAMKAAGTLRFQGQHDLARDAVYAGWDESGRPGLDEALTGSSFSDKQRLAEILARRRVVTLGPEGAIRWAEALPDPSYSQMMKVRVASAAAGTKTGAAVVAKWATPQILESKVPTGYPRRIGTRWILHDPDAALAWLASLPGGEDRNDGVAESYRDWMRRDYLKATAWADAMAKGEIPLWAEHALSVYAKTYALEHPEEALALTSRFTDASLREGTTIAVARLWMQDDEKAAKAWVDKNLTPELAARVGGKVENPNLPRANPRKRRGAGAAEQPAPGPSPETAVDPLAPMT